MKILLYFVIWTLAHSVSKGLELHFKEEITLSDFYRIEPRRMTPERS